MSVSRTVKLWSPWCHSVGHCPPFHHRTISSCAKWPFFYSPVQCFYVTGRSTAMWSCSGSLLPFNFWPVTDICRNGCTAYVKEVVYSIDIRDAPIMHWPIIGRPIIGAKQSADYRLITDQYKKFQKQDKSQQFTLYNSTLTMDMCGVARGAGRGCVAWSITTRAAHPSPLTSRPMVTAWHDSIRLIFTPSNTTSV